MAPKSPQDRLQDWLYRYRLTRADLAVRTGASQAGLSRWVAGTQAGFSLQTARRLAETTGLPLRLFRDRRTMRRAA